MSAARRAPVPVVAAVAMLAGACHSCAGEPPVSGGRPAGSGALVASIPPTSSPATAPEAPPMRAIADSPSVILRAAHVVVITVARLEEGPSRPGPRGSQTRDIQIDATLSESLGGGPLATGAGGALRISGVRSQPGPRDSVAPGAWSQVELTPGARLMVFSSSPATEVSAVFAEPALLRVVPADPVLPEVRRILQIERDRAPLAQAITSTAEPPALSAFFGEYVVARLAGEVLYSDPKTFDQVMIWLEGPGRSAETRRVCVELLTASLLATEPNPPGFTERLALTALRILQSAPDDPLASQIESTYLPNLLGLEGTSPRKTAQSVFGSDDAAKKQARDALSRRPKGPGRDRLLDWLGR